MAKSSAPLAEIEKLIEGVEGWKDADAQAQAHELVRTLLALHGAGFERALEIIYDGKKTGAELIDDLGRDETVSNLLLLHGLHPLSLEERVRGAVEEVKPRLGQHGGSVQLLGVTPEGTVRLQLEGNCEGCPSSRITLKYSIEEAIYAAAPDVTALEVNGLVEEHAPPAANPKFTECPTHNGNGQQPATGENK